MNKKQIKIIIIELIFLLGVYGFLNSELIQWMPSCWIYQTTGILCPACGGTRCVVELVRGNWCQAFFYHKIFFILIIYVLIINIAYIINLNREKKVAMWVYPKYWYMFIFVILLIAYTIIRNLL